MDSDEKMVADVMAGAPAPAGVVVGQDDLIEKLNKAVDRAEAANRVTAELLARQERLRVESVIGGSASAGSPVVSDEAKARRAAKEYLAGTGFENELFPDV